MQYKNVLLIFVTIKLKNLKFWKKLPLYMAIVGLYCYRNKERSYYQ